MPKKLLPMWVSIGDMPGVLKDRLEGGPGLENGKGRREARPGRLVDNSGGDVGLHFKSSGGRSGGFKDSSDLSPSSLRAKELQKKKGIGAVLQEVTLAWARLGQWTET